jgi:MFS family permease
MGSVATALGALAAGWTVQLSENAGIDAVQADRAILVAYAAIGLALALAFSRLTSAVEPSTLQGDRPSAFLGLHKSRRVVLKLSSLFALDAFAGGFILQSFMAYWFTVRWHADPKSLGNIFFFANLFSGLSGLVAARLADRIGLVNTMVFTHIPSNVLLILVPLMPSFGWAMAMLLARFAISQMDVPTRQSFVAAVVAPDERSAAAGVTNIFRSCGAMLAPTLAGILMGSPQTLSVPFYIAGGLKIVYDLTLLAMFRQTADVAETSIDRRK